MNSRVTGPFGEFTRRQMLSSDKYPVEYLAHLVNIGVAEYTIEHKLEPKIEVKALKKVDSKKPLSASQLAQASRKKTAKKSKKAN